MIQEIFSTLITFNDFIWGYIAFFFILILGGYFTFSSRLFQIRKFKAIIANFFALSRSQSASIGVHPLKTFYAAIGGCIGIGNIVGICTAIQIGGPGALFWTWIGGFFGTLLLYAEVYLGMIYRIRNKQKSYDGGPMYFLPKAFKSKWVGVLASVLLCLYGIEIFMFNVMTNSLVVNWHLNKFLVVGVLIAFVLIVTLGGIERVGQVGSRIIPPFVFLYLVMGLWIICIHLPELPHALAVIFKGAFTYQAALGGFAGSSVMLAISMGLSRGAYSADIGIGHMSVVHAESSEKDPSKQAALAFMVVLLDTFVFCSVSAILVVLTEKWHTSPDVVLMVQEALAVHFPYMNIFMPLFLFLLGYTTIIVYFAMGVKCAKFISPKYGPPAYYAVASIGMTVFAFVDPTQAFVIESICGAILLIINSIGMFLLRKEIKFNLSSD